MKERNKMNKKININLNGFYLLGIVIYGVIVTNMYTEYRVLQTFNDFSVGLANVLALFVFGVFGILLVGVLAFIITLVALKSVTTVEEANNILENTIKDHEKWVKDTTKVVDKKLDIYTVLFFLLFILTVMGGGNFTAMILILIFMTGRVLKSSASACIVEFNRIILLIKDSKNDE
jgi:hypothetical protein